MSVQCFPKCSFWSPRAKLQTVLVSFWEAVLVFTDKDISLMCSLKKINKTVDILT